jgi:hypothetical protein
MLDARAPTARCSSSGRARAQPAAAHQVNEFTGPQPAARVHMRTLRIGVGLALRLRGSERLLARGSERAAPLSTLGVRIRSRKVG